MATRSSILAWRIPMERAVWQVTVHGVAELDMTEQLSISQVQPALTALATGPGPRSQRIHLLPCSRHTDTSVGTRAAGRWMFQGSAQTGIGFQSVSLPWM